jgi:3',5'-cyclic AMP phosphodiesterase CpdA
MSTSGPSPAGPDLKPAAPSAGEALRIRVAHAVWQKVATHSPRLFRFLRALAGVLVLVVDVDPTLATQYLPANVPEETGSGLWVAQITDPHLFEEAEKRETWRQDEQDDQDAFASALRYLRNSPAVGGRTPDVLVITGDWGLDPTFMQKRSGPDALTRQREVETVANLLRGSPVKRILTVVGNNDLPDELANRANLEEFNRFFDSVAVRLKGTGIELHNLTECYAGRPIAKCAIDVAGVRFVGLASGSFKNDPKTLLIAPVKPAAPPSGQRDMTTYDAAKRLIAATTQARGDAAVMSIFARLVTNGDRVVVLTHEPDVDDPQGLKLIADERQSDPRAPARQAAVWNVAPIVRQQWLRAATRKNVIAVIAGHLHSANPADYRLRYVGSFANGGGHPPLFIGPPLAIKFQRGTPTQARGLSLYRIAGREVERQFVWLTALHEFRSERGPEPAAHSPSTTRTFGERIMDRVAIVLLGVLGAGLGVMSGFGLSLPRWRRPPPAQRPALWWLEHLSMFPVVTFGLGGLGLALVLFADTWQERRTVSATYLVAYLTVAILASVSLRRAQRTAE